MVSQSFMYPLNPSFHMVEIVSGSQVLAMKAVLGTDFHCWIGPAKVI